MTDRPATIPSYVLYGEEAGANPTGFGHIETIAERSLLHDWEIAPHRHRDSVQVLFLSAGEVAVTLDGHVSRHVGPCHVTIPAGAVHGFRFSPQTCGYVLTLGQEFARRSEGPGDPLAKLLTEGGRGPLPPDTARRINVLADELLALARNWPGSGGPFHALAEALLRSLPVSSSGGESGDDRRLALFRHLVEVHLAEHRPVSFYAASIGVTERTLGRLVQRRLGCTPKEAVHRRLVLEARRLLRYTNASVAQVADELGFDDPSYFSRFYLRMTGNRPARERT
ncbi:MAG: helix-turn-helix domain-containing protein [Novosphingobium sp.]